MLGAVCHWRLNRLESSIVCSYSTPFPRWLGSCDICVIVCVTGSPALSDPSQLAWACSVTSSNCADKDVCQGRPSLIADRITMHCSGGEMSKIRRTSSGSYAFPTGRSGGLCACCSTVKACDGRACVPARVPVADSPRNSLTSSSSSSTRRFKADTLVSCSLAVAYSQDVSRLVQLEHDGLAASH